MKDAPWSAGNPANLGCLTGYVTGSGCAHRLFFNKAGVAQLLGAHVVHMGDGQAAQRLADELDVVPLYVAHHQDLRLCLIRRACHQAQITQNPMFYSNLQK